MKGIMKCLSMMTIITGLSVVAEQLMIINKSGAPVYIALATTTNSSSDKKIAKSPKRLFAKVLGTINNADILSNNAYIEVENLPKAETKLGITMYNRSIWITSTSRSLHTALSQPQGMGTSGVRGKAFRLGSAKTVTITKKGENFVVSTSNKFTPGDNTRANRNRSNEWSEMIAS